MCVFFLVFWPWHQDCCTIYMSNPSAEEPLKTKVLLARDRDVGYVGHGLLRRKVFNHRKCGLHGIWMGYPPVNEQSANWYRWHIYIRTFTSMIYHDLRIFKQLNIWWFSKARRYVDRGILGIKIMLHPLTDSASEPQTFKGLDFESSNLTSEDYPRSTLGPLNK